MVASDIDDVSASAAGAVTVVASVLMYGAAVRALAGTPADSPSAGHRRHLRVDPPLDQLSLALGAAGGETPLEPGRTSGGEPLTASRASRHPPAVPTPLSQNAAIVSRSRHRPQRRQRVPVGPS